MPTKQEIWYLATVWICFVNGVALYSISREMPSLLLRLSTIDIIGAISYTLMFALVESVTLSLLSSFLNALIPRRLVSPPRFAVRGGLLVIVGVLLILSIGARDIEMLVRALAGAIAAALLVALILRREKFVALIDDLLDRLTVLSGLFLFLDVLGIVVVILRNLG